MTKEISIEDYRYCSGCEEYVDFWKYDTLEDTGHEVCQLRAVTLQEFWTLVKSCFIDGCFIEEFLDSSKNRKSPKYLPPVCPSCGQWLVTVNWSQDDRYKFSNGMFTDDGMGTGETKCPNCNTDLYELFEDGPVNFHSVGN